jgi:hypothetical protein
MIGVRFKRNILIMCYFFFFSLSLIIEYDLIIYIGKKQMILFCYKQRKTQVNKKKKHQNTVYVPFIGESKKILFERRAHYKKKTTNKILNDKNY